MKRFRVTGAVFVALSILVSLEADAVASALTLDEFTTLQDWLVCQDRCEHGRYALYGQCLTACVSSSEKFKALDVNADGQLSVSSEVRAWDKNIDGKITVDDEHLALREIYDNNSGDYVCYNGDAVQHIEQCDCRAKHTENECLDSDGDGLRNWMETVLGTSLTTANVTCDSNVNCHNASLTQTCEYFEAANRGMCVDRSCASAGTCTAFHLETVDKNDSEVVLRVVYDYFSISPTTLDLQLKYSNEVLELTDSRPLKSATEAGKAVFVTQPSANTIRLVVLGETSSMPISPGPIAELVFRRTTAESTQASVGFATGPAARTSSLAAGSQAEEEAIVSDLAKDWLWGPDVNANPDKKKQLLHYSFDDLSAPLASSSIKTEDVLCGVLNSCSGNGVSPAEKISLTNQLKALQVGVVNGTALAKAVSNAGLVLDGRSGHVELPLTINEPQNSSEPYRDADQSFSFSTWLNHDSPATGKPEVVFSHNNNSNELTKFGVAAIPSATQSRYDLVWFFGDISDESTLQNRTRLIKSNLVDRTWVHLGVSVDAATALAAVYVDGVASSQKYPLGDAGDTTVLGCPGLNPSTRELSIKKIGTDIPSGSPEEVISFASSRNNLYGIEQIDANGLGQKTLLRATGSSAMDPDYSPIADRIVFTSTASGGAEIWIANADGSSPQQITQGFGATSIGSFARRPKWSPDGTGIVFESNAFSTSFEDNTWAKLYHLYYIAYDPISAKVVIPSGKASAATLSLLDYELAVASGTIQSYRISTTSTDHSSNVQWVRGKYEVNTDSYLGDLLVTQSSSDYREDVVASYSVRAKSSSNPEILPPLSAVVLNPFEVAKPSSRPLVLLAAKRTKPASSGGQTTVRHLFAEQHVSFETVDDFSVTTSSSSGSGCPVGKQAFAVTVYYDGNGEAPAFEANSLLLNFDPTKTAPAIDLDSRLVTTTSSALTELKKTFSARVAYGTTRSDVVLQISSPENIEPIPADTELASIVLCGDVSGISLHRRIVSQQLYLQSVINGVGAPQVFNVDPLVDEVLAAEFSPTADALALSVIRNARPELIKIPDLSNPRVAETLSIAPARVEGLNWSKKDKFFPCNWIGAMRSPYNGEYLNPFKGGVDEFRLYNYVRTPDAFASEAARGDERLEKNELGGVGSGIQRLCQSNADCPTYYLCSPNAAGGASCQIKPCVVGQPGSCGVDEGTCKPVPISLANAGTNACVVDCVTDNQCFEKECLNGPCRFCEAGACIECRETLEVISPSAGIKIRSIVGCPDRNSYACSNGSCVTECYSFENGQSRYLCDRATEYCSHGRCALLDWNWADFALATMSGGGETKYTIESIPRTIAQPDFYPIEITALGVSDYLEPPEILVEGKYPAVYGGDWFDIGRIKVFNTRKQEALFNKYTLLSPLPIAEIRVRLANSIYSDFNCGATGLLERQKLLWGDANDPRRDPKTAYRRRPGSIAMLGYPAAFSQQEVENADPADPDALADQNYLRAGEPTVVILDVKVNGNSVAVQNNTICSYDGGLNPIDVNTGKPRRLFYGSPSEEISNQAKSYSMADWLKPGLVDNNASPIILNCNYAKPKIGGGTEQIAAYTALVTFPATGIASNVVNGKSQETANGCFVQETVGSIGGTTISRPCYEWVGDSATADFLSTETELKYRTLEIEGLTSFGWDGNP